MITLRCCAVYVKGNEWIDGTSSSLMVLVRLLGRGLIGLMIFSASFAIVSWMAYRHIQPPPPKVSVPFVIGEHHKIQSTESLSFRDDGSIHLGSFVGVNDFVGRITHIFSARKRLMIIPA